MIYTLLNNLVCLYDGDHTTHQIPAGEIIETLTPPNIGVIHGRHNGRCVRVLAIDLKRFGHPLKASSKQGQYC